MSEPTPENEADLAALLKSGTVGGGSKLAAAEDGRASAPAALRLLRRSTEPAWKQPSLVHLAADGALWVLDRPDAGRFRIGRYSSDGAELAVCFVPRGSGEAALADPAALAVDGDGNFWIVDGQENCLRKLAGDGTLLDVLRSAGSKGKLFSSPQDVALDGVGFLYIADTLNSRIVKLSVEGEAVWAVEKYQLPSGETDELYEPASLAWSSTGVLWVADRAQNRVLGFNDEGKVIHEWPGELLSNPLAVRASGNGDVVVADQSFQRIRRFSPDGAAKGTLSFPVTAADGTSYEGGGPMAVDGAGRVYVVDVSHEAILIANLAEEAR